jgi:hypothetical protein
MIGYQSPDSAAVIKTFKRKYLKINDNAELNTADKKVLYAVWRELF